MTCDDKLTVTTDLQVYHTPDTDVDDTEKPLVLFLELLLVKDLNCQYTFITGSPVQLSALCRATIPDSYAHVEAFIPIRIQCLLDDSSGLGLLSVEGSDREGVRETWYD